MGSKEEEVQQLVARAEHAVSTLQPELACKFYERALEKAPENTAVMDSLGELLVGLGQPEKAKELFETSIRLQPESSASKWLYLGQLQEGLEAKQSFSKGAELLLAELKKREKQSKKGKGKKGAKTGGQEEEDEEVLVLKDQLCSTYCSIGELYLTDLCFEDNAEQECQDALSQALKYDQGSAEVTQALASLRLSQVKGEEAAALMIETYRRLKHYDEESLPGVAFRVNTAKLLLECGAHEKKCTRMAVDVLEMCKCEDDENAEVWYLLGVAYFTRSKPDLDLARAHVEGAKALLLKAKEQGEAGEEVAEQLKLVEEQLALIREAEEKGTCNGDDGEDDEDEDDEEDSEDEDDMEMEEGDAMEQDDADSS